MPESKQDFFRRYVKAIAETDFEPLQPMIHHRLCWRLSAVGRALQRLSGLQIPAREISGWPAGRALRRPEHKGARRGRALGNLARLHGSSARVPERFTTVTRAPYPDGSRWWVVSILTMKDDKVWHAETYFAPEFEPPEWRKGMVEIIPRD